MKLFKYSIIIGSIIFQTIWSQTYPPPTNLVTVPSAGTLVRGSFAMQMRVQKGGGLTTSLRVGITDRFQFGLSYGSANLIGDDSLIWHPKPEASLKYRLIDETESFPGLSIGIDTQGQGQYHSADSLMRYDVKAMGMYIATSKNWVTPLGNLGLHLLIWHRIWRRFRPCHFRLLNKQAWAISHLRFLLLQDWTRPRGFAIKEHIPLDCHFLGTLVCTNNGNLATQFLF